MSRVVVIGGGVAGCAAAVAAAGAGAAVTLLERHRHLGGVAAQGEHRTICGLAPIDAAEPGLLEPALTAGWVEALATGAPERRGRVWLWPTDSAALQAGLARRLDEAGVTVRQGVAPRAFAVRDGRIGAVDAIACDAVVDAAGACPPLLGLPVVAAGNWASHRSVVELDLADGRSARVGALRAVAEALGGSAACSLESLGAGRWQLSLDVAPGTAAAQAADLAERAAAALGGRLLACAWRVAERDEGRAPGGLDLDRLFAQRERGLCWAAWPREQHGAAGVAWTWPPGDRHGVPEEAVRLPGSPANLWLVGKAMAVAPGAAAALRVIGTGLAIGAAVGRRVVR